MGVGAFRRHSITRGVAWLALPALLLRLLVPAGFMPGVGADDSLTMQMCHGSGSTSLALRAPETTEPDDGSADHGSPCLYAATSVTAPPPAVTGAASVATPQEVATRTPPASAALRSLHRPQAPRAPPARS